MSESYRVYTPPAAGSIDPYTIGITGGIPAFFDYRTRDPRNVIAAEVTATPVGDGSDGGDQRPPALSFVPNPPGVTTIGGGPAGGIYVASPFGPPASPSTGSIAQDLANIAEMPGLALTGLGLLAGPAAIPGIMAGTALSSLSSDPRVTGLMGGIGDLISDLGRTPEERAARAETARDFNALAQRDAEARMGITVESLPAPAGVAVAAPQAPAQEVGALEALAPTQSALSNVFGVEQPAAPGPGTGPAPGGPTAQAAQTAGTVGVDAPPSGVQGGLSNISAPSTAAPAQPAADPVAEALSDLENAVAVFSEARTPAQQQMAQEAIDAAQARAETVLSEVQTARGPETSLEDISDRAPVVSFIDVQPITDRITGQTVMSVTVRSEPITIDRTVSPGLVGLETEDEEEGVYSGGGEGPGARGGMTEAEAMAQGMQSPTFGTGTYGFGTNPSAGIGSGNFGAMSAAERGETVGPPGTYGETVSAGFGGGGAPGPGAPGDFGAPDGLGEGWGDTVGIGDVADAQAAANEAAQAEANAAAANADADASPGGVNSGDTPGAPGGESPGDAGDGGDGGDGGYYQGGMVRFAEGGLVPLAGGGKIAIGPGGGLDDLIPTSINGRRAAALSDGEFVIPADVVSMMGDGSSNAGARRLYDLVRQIRDAKTGTTKQAGPLPVGEILKRSIGR